jgi:16S rRNA (guanine527-N7)-methyltransferase
MKPEIFYQDLAKLGFELTDLQKKQFQDYFRLLVEWNQHINLTAITAEEDDVYLKHLLRLAGTNFAGLCLK